MPTPGRNIAVISDNLVDADAILQAVQALFNQPLEVTPAQAAGFSLIIQSAREKIALAEGAL